MSDVMVTEGPMLRGADIPRPDETGYCLSLYDDLRRWIPQSRRKIDMHRREIARHSRALTAARQRLVLEESTLAWMREHQADEIAEVEARREQVRVRLRTAGWKV